MGKIKRFLAWLWKAFKKPTKLVDTSIPDGSRGFQAVGWMLRGLAALATYGVYATLAPLGFLILFILFIPVGLGSFFPMAYLFAALSSVLPDKPAFIIASMLWFVGLSLLLATAAIVLVVGLPLLGTYILAYPIAHAYEMWVTHQQGARWRVRALCIPVVLVGLLATVGNDPPSPQGWIGVLASGLGLVLFALTITNPPNQERSTPVAFDTVDQ